VPQPPSVITLQVVRRALAPLGAVPGTEPAGPSAAVALILSPGDHGNLDTLFIRRAARAGDPWSGQVALPGGRRSTGDPDLTATAVRETEEEIAVVLRRAERLAALADLHPRTPVLPPLIVRPFVFALDDRPAVRAGAEVHSVFWTPLSTLLAPGARRDIILPLRTTPPRTGPAYVIGADTIWGMTERIITALLEILSLPV